MVGTVFCYFIAISFGIAIPIIIYQIPLREQKARVIEYKAEQELKLATIEKNLLRKEYVTSEQCVP